jgi:integrase
LDFCKAKRTGFSNLVIVDAFRLSWSNVKGRFRLYDMRHTFATRAARADMSLPTLAAILGHTTIQMTMRYVQPAAEEKRQSMQKFEKFRAEGIINAAAGIQSHGVTTKVTTVDRVN